MLVSNLHQPDQELLRLLQLCVAGQEIASMEEAQSLLLRNFRVGKDNQSECAQWLTDMAKDLLAPIPFREGPWPFSSRNSRSWMERAHSKAYAPALR